MLGRRCDLRDDLPENVIGGREADRALDLDLQNSGVAAGVVRVHDDVVERPPFGRTLKLDRIDRSTGQPPRLATRQQGEQIRGADLPLEMAACRSARRRASCASCHAPDFLTRPGRVGLDPTDAGPSPLSPRYLSV